MSQSSDLEGKERDVGKEAINPQSKRAWTLTQSQADGYTFSVSG